MDFVSIDREKSTMIPSHNLVPSLLQRHNYTKKSKVYQGASDLLLFCLCAETQVPLITMTILCEWGYHQHPKSMFKWTSKLSNLLRENKNIYWYSHLLRDNRWTQILIYAITSIYWRWNKYFQVGIRLGTTTNYRYSGLRLVLNTWDGWDLWSRRA